MYYNRIRTPKKKTMKRAGNSWAALVCNRQEGVTRLASAVQMNYSEAKFIAISCELIIA